MSNDIHEKLKEANKKIDNILPSVWNKAEENLNKLEIEYLKKKK